MNPLAHGREQAVRFGAAGALCGVLTDVSGTAPSGGKTGVLFLNSGILHRIGTCRLHVRLARQLSAVGIPSLRFDYSGIGDSEQRRDALSFEESAIVETREAMDYLAGRKGVEQFVLIGLCSGADMAHETALVDPRVCGLMLIDGWAYQTLPFYFHHYRRRVRRWGAWKNAVKIRWQMLTQSYQGRRSSGAADGVEYDIPKYVRVFPPKHKIAKDLAKFVERKIQMYFVWTSGLPEYNHEGQYRSTFRSVQFGSLLREEHLEGATHIVSGLDHQEILADRVIEWARRCFGSR